ncbi:MAG: L-rhamnose mutarotase [Mycobacteriales bacterium]
MGPGHGGSDIGVPARAVDAGGCAAIRHGRQRHFWTQVAIPRKEPAIKRFASVTGLRPERRDDYLRLHAAVWPGVADMITKCNIRNYTIFEHNDLLFSYFEYIGDDFEADMTRMARDPDTQRWWRQTDPCQLPPPNATTGQWAVLPEIWHQA